MDNCSGFIEISFLLMFFSFWLSAGFLRRPNPAFGRSAQVADFISGQRYTRALLYNYRMPVRAKTAPVSN